MTLRIIAHFNKAVICLLAASMILGNTPASVSAYTAAEQAEDVRLALAAMSARTSQVNDSAATASTADGGQGAAADESSAADASGTATVFQMGGVYPRRLTR